MKKYIKPKIEIIHAAPAHLMGISTMKLSTNTSVFYDADKEKNSDFNIISSKNFQYFILIFRKKLLFYYYIIIN